MLSKSSCPVHSALRRVLDSLCELCFLLQIAAAKIAVCNGAVAVENCAGVVSSGNGNGAAGTVQSTSQDTTKDFCAPWFVLERGIAHALSLMAASDLFQYNQNDMDSTVWRAKCALVAYTGLVRVLSCLGTQN